MKRLFTTLILMAVAVCSMAQNGEGGYIEDFEGSHYDGTSYLPVGWDTTGAQPFYTMSWYTLPAHSGTYYAISIDINKYETLTARNDWMYTCAFNLEAGVKYRGTYWLHNDSQGASSVAFTVGSSQDAENQQVLHTITEATEGDWQEVSFEFTPDRTDNYYFGWNITSPDRRTTFVAIDDFSIIAAWMTNLPKANFCINHIYDITTGDLIAYPDQQIQLYNYSEKADSYLWEADNDNVVFSDNEAAEPTMCFKKTGPVTITLNAINATGTTKKEMYIWPSMGDELSYYGVSTFDGGNSDELIQRGLVPTFKTDLDFDFVTGPNHLYREFAERYAFAEGSPVKLHTINVFLTEYNLRTDMWQTQQNIPVEVVVYGEKNGMPDEDHIFGSSSATIKDWFGTTGVGGTSAEPRNIVLDNPIVVDGPCYISFKISDEFCIDDDAVGQVIRSYFCFAPIKRAKNSTMKVKPFYLPGGIATPTLQLGDWCTAAQLDADIPEGLGMYNIVWVSKHTETGIQNVSTNEYESGIYNIAGQRLDRPQKGVNIKGGKKYIIR